MMSERRDRCFGMRVAAAMLAVCGALLGGCQQPLEPVFPLQADAPRWPAPPEPTRVIYIGQLLTSNDLKARPTGLEAIGQFIFGKPEAYAMLTPMALCTDGGERVFVADSNAQCVHMFDLKTRVYATWKPPAGQQGFAMPVGIAWDGSGEGGGRVIVADSVVGALASFDVAGKFLGWIGAGSLQRPVGMVVDRETGRLFVADTKAHQVIVFERNGRVARRVGGRGTRAGEFNFPTHVALDREGRLYVTDTLNFRVQVFDRDLRAVRQFGRKGDVPGYFAQPKGIATDSDGHVYVVDTQFENVQLFDEGGHMLMDFGEEGIDRGQFWLPAAIFIDQRDRIWIADSYNKRVQVFDYLKVTEPAATGPASQPATATITTTTAPATAPGTQAETRP